MHPRWALLAGLMVLASGCLGTGDQAVQPEGGAASAAGITPVRERADLPFVKEGDWSHPLKQGSHGILDAIGVAVDVDVPLGNGLPVQQVHLGLFLPDMAGCDLTASEVPEACKVPVIADAGPYYGDGDTADTEPAGRLGAFLIENFVPHGYAVAQVSVLGTGKSVGCMDLMGEVEQAGVQAAVEWLGRQPWSNGNVALIGRSYDGSTPWEAAMAAPEHLKTIVPISGLYGQYDLMWRNGSAETRGPGALWAIYYLDAFQGEEPPLQAQQVAAHALCPDSHAGLPNALGAYATGDRFLSAANPYWLEREFRTEVLANYRGSVYFIHGMQDWNVDPHMAFPFYQELQAKGLEMKGLFGQWGHMYPDRPGEHENLLAYPATVRWDWAQDLLEWFEHYLKGTGPKPELHVEMQDDLGAWRIEQTWPPADVALVELAFGDGLALEGTNTLVAPGPPNPMGTLPVGGSQVVLRSEPLAAPMRIAGLAQLHVTVTPQAPGGQLYAELRDVDAEGRRLGHAIMDLRFAAGGEEAQPVAPQQPLLAQMEFFAMDTEVPAGHTLELVLANTGRDYLPSADGGPVEVQVDGSSVLRLPVVVRGAEAFFAPPG